MGGPLRRGRTAPSDAHRADREVRRRSRRVGASGSQRIASRRAGGRLTGQRRAACRPAGEARRQRLTAAAQGSSGALMLRIGLTGGIGAGKSAVSATFAEYGGIVVDGDVIAREVVEPGTEGLAALVDAFGDDILLPDGTLDRSALAAKAFTDDATRDVLNGIVHPLVAHRR